MRYYQIKFHPVTSEQIEILVATLSEAGFEGFEEDELTLDAFIPENKWNKEALDEILEISNLPYDVSIIEETNWNQVWESNFSPVVVDDFVGIRAEFHEPFKNVQEEIVITPKMSFGTGHHATTHMMIQQMRKIDFKGKHVLDFGTGTGILAILAERLGARKIIAIDNDEWSITNAEENLGRNRCQLIELIKLEEPVSNEKFDVILANINKHIILANLPVLANSLSQNGTLLLSGLLTTDQGDIMAAASPLGLLLTERVEKHNWLALRLSN